MASTVVEICNSALTKLGSKTISSLTENKKEAELCNLRYEPCRDYVLREHPWNCAIKRVLLSPETSSPAFGYSYQFQLPTDWLRTLSIESDDDYRMEGGKIVSNSTTSGLKYIWKVSDPTLFDSHVAEAIACYMAYDISYALLQIASMKDLHWRLYQEVLRRGKSIDAKEDPTTILEANAWINSRTGRA